MQLLRWRNSRVTIWRADSCPLSGAFHKRRKRESVASKNVDLSDVPSLVVLAIATPREDTIVRSVVTVMLVTDLVLVPHLWKSVQLVVRVTRSRKEDLVDSVLATKNHVVLLNEITTRSLRLFRTMPLLSKVHLRTRSTAMLGLHEMPCIR